MHQRRPVHGNPATGEHAEWLGVGVYTVRVARIAEAWFAMDILGVLLSSTGPTLPV